jgi:hypothetical protein
MKYRDSFISNSSSTSFIIGLENKPKSVEETQQLLFGNEKYLPDCFNDAILYPAKEIAKVVFEDLISTKSLQDDEFIDLVYSLELQDESLRNPEYWENKDIEKMIHEICKSRAKDTVSFLKRKWSNRQFYHLEYNDDTDIGCAIENGGVFGLLPHIEINNH